MTTSNEHNNAPAVPRVEVCCQQFDTCRNQCVPLVDHLRGQIKELKAAPAVPDAAMVKRLQEEIERGCDGLALNEAYARAVLEYVLATPAPAPAQGEPFGHFRAEPFGWTDCAEDDEGAIALYERPQEAGLPYRKEYASLPPMPWKRRNLGGLIEVVDANGNPVLPWLAFDAAAPGGRSTFKKRNAIALFIADMTSLYVDTPPATDAGVVEERFTKDVPTEQGWYWHWNGDEECRPLPTSVLWSGCTKSCFVSTGQLGLTQAVDCKEYGGYWLKMTEPWGAIDALRAKGGK